MAQKELEAEEKRSEAKTVMLKPREAQAVSELAFSMSSPKERWSESDIIREALLAYPPLKRALKALAGNG